MTPFLQLLFSLTIIITGAKAGGRIANWLRQPAVLGELLVGVLLGPSLLDLLGQGILANPDDPKLLHVTILELAELGVICLMFMAGLEIDLERMLRSGRVSLLAGLNGVLVPLVFGWLAAWLFGYQVSSALFVGIILTATSVSISAQTLLELGKLRTREGLALLGAAVIDDVVVVLLLSTFMAMTGGTSGSGLWLVPLKMALYLGLATAVAFLLLPRIAAWVDRQPISEGLISFVMVSALAFAWSAELAGGLVAITGAFIAGLGFGRSHLRDKIARAMHTITYAFFVPIFFVNIGLETDLHQLAGRDLPFALVLIGVAIVAKVIGCGLGARMGGFTNHESLRVGVGMVSRGEVGLIIASVGVEAGIIETDLFSVVTLLVLATTLVTPPLLRLTYIARPGETGRAGEAKKEAEHA
ncbi:MAG: cation:proton antiporter [Thermoflexales bacterium]|nr:cation:proton antiporter [Thermoflexales bacterium]